MSVGPQVIEGLNMGAYACSWPGVGENGKRDPVSMIKSVTIGAIKAEAPGLFSLSFDGAEGGETQLRPMRVGYAALLRFYFPDASRTLAPMRRSRICASGQFHRGCGRSR